MHFNDLKYLLLIIIIVLIKGINNTYTLQKPRSNIEEISKFNPSIEKRSKIDYNAQKRNKLLHRADIRHSLRKKIHNKHHDRFNRDDIGLRHLKTQKLQGEKKSENSKRMKRLLTGDLLQLDNNNIFTETNPFLKYIARYQNKENNNNMNKVELSNLLQQASTVPIPSVEPLYEAERMLSEINRQTTNTPFVTENPLFTYSSVNAQPKINAQLLSNLRKDLNLINELQKVINEVTMSKKTSKRRKRNSLKPPPHDTVINKYEFILSGLIKARLCQMRNKSKVHLENTEFLRTNNKHN